MGSQSGWKKQGCGGWAISLLLCINGLRQAPSLVGPLFLKSFFLVCNGGYWLRAMTTESWVWLESRIFLGWLPLYAAS